MPKYNSAQIREYILADIEGKREFLLTAKQKAHKEIYFHFSKLKKLIGPDIIFDPDKIYPQIADHFHRISVAIRKLSIASTLLNQFILDALYLARENYRKSPNDFLKEIIIEIEHDILPVMQDYYMFTQKFREHIPMELSEQIRQQQVLPSKPIKEFLNALEELEKMEKHVGKRMQDFFRRHKHDVKDLFNAVQSVERGQMGVLGKFAASHPPTVVGTICLCFTVIGYAGVFITLGYGIAGVLGGGSVIGAIFGVAKGGGLLKNLGNMFFSSGTSVLSMIVDKGVGLLAS